MVLFFTLLPLYLVGNLHCLGMCGPLVMMLGQHRYRYLYFLGRFTSFSFAGLLAAEMGQVVGAALHTAHLSAALCLGLGSAILLFGVCEAVSVRLVLVPGLAPLIAAVSRRTSMLMLKDSPWSTFLFGLSTILLPCGQTLVIFAALATSGAPLTGLFNGMAFALLTTPSLFMAMRAYRFLGYIKQVYRPLFGLTAALFGVVTICRGLADLEWIPHLVLSHRFHLVLC